MFSQAGLTKRRAAGRELLNSKAQLSERRLGSRSVNCQRSDTVGAGVAAVHVRCATPRLVWKWSVCRGGFGAAARVGETAGFGVSDASTIVDDLDQHQFQVSMTEIRAGRAGCSVIQLGRSTLGVAVIAYTLLEICEGTSTKITRWPLRITTPRLPATNSQTTAADAAES